MDTPTPKQLEILAFIRRYTDSEGLPPSRSEIGNQFGITRQSAEQQLGALVKKGWLDMRSGTSRGLRLTEQALASLGGANDAGTLPLIGRIAAGQPLLAPDQIEDRLRIDPELFNPRADFLYRVKGHSMERAGILSGDLVGIQQRDVAENREIVAVAIEDRDTSESTLTLKRYHRQGQIVTLLSENDDQDRYAPIRIDLREQRVHIVGLFAGLVRIPGRS
jgi:repressor LexA